MKKQLEVNENRIVLNARIEIDDTITSFRFIKVDNEFYLFDNGHLWEFAEQKPAFIAKLENENSGASSSSDTTAPMPGIVEKILVEPGQNVNQNDPLVVMVAMKMEYVIRATKKCQIGEILCKVGDNVSKGDHLVTFMP